MGGILRLIRAHYGIGRLIGRLIGDSIGSFIGGLIGGLNGRLMGGLMAAGGALAAVDPPWEHIGSIVVVGLVVEMYGAFPTERSVQI